MLSDIARALPSLLSSVTGRKAVKKSPEEQAAARAERREGREAAKAAREEEKAAEYSLKLEEKATKRADKLALHPRKSLLG